MRRKSRNPSLQKNLVRTSTSCFPPYSNGRTASTDLLPSSFEVTVCWAVQANEYICLTRDQVTLADQQADPNSPLYSAKTFEQLGL